MSQTFWWLIYSLMADLLVLSFGHWDLFDIWFLVLGVFMILINKIIIVNPIGYLVILRDLGRGDQ
jgi:hypothetical protein